VHAMEVHLMGGHLIGGHLMSGHLMGGHLIGVHLIGGHLWAGILEARILWAWASRAEIATLILPPGPHPGIPLCWVAYGGVLWWAPNGSVDFLSYSPYPIFYLIFRPISGLLSLLFSVLLLLLLAAVLLGHFKRPGTPAPFPRARPSLTIGSNLSLLLRYFPRILTRSEKALPDQGVITWRGVSAKYTS
jgi:hypothetical protein